MWPRVSGLGPLLVAWLKEPVLLSNKALATRSSGRKKQWPDRDGSRCWDNLLRNSEINSEIHDLVVSISGGT